MIRPVRLANDLGAEHEFLLTEKREHRRHVDQLDAETFGRVDEAGVAGADVGAAGFLVAA